MELSNDDIQYTRKNKKVFIKYINTNYTDDINKLNAFEVYLKVNNKGNKGKLKYIDQCIRRIQNGGKKSGNGSDESIRLKWLEEQINNNTEFGTKFKDDYKKFYNKTIQKIEIIGGRKKHYDFIIHHIDGTSYKCEEKGTKDRYDLNKSETPWQKAVQRLNGNLKDFDITYIYAKIWYNTIVCSDEINEMIGNTLPPPPFDEWWINDCCPQGNPKTEWGIDNKKNCKNNDYVDGNKKRVYNKPLRDISKNIYRNISHNTYKNHINTNPFNKNMTDYGDVFSNKEIILSQSSPDIASGISIIKSIT